MTNLYHYIARASADTNAGLKLETQIRLSNMVFWITDSQLKGQLDMSTDARIYHDTMPMYRPAANPRGEAPCRSCNPLGRSHVTQRRLASFPLSLFHSHSWTRHQSEVLIAAPPSSSQLSPKQPRRGTMPRSIRPAHLTAALVLAEQHTSPWCGVSGSRWAQGQAIPFL